MTQEDKDLLTKDLCARLFYGVRGKVKVDTIIPHQYDINGFPEETTFDVDVELLKIDTSNDEIFVSTFDDNEDLGNYIEECQIEGTPWLIEEFTPYLRTMSSMTEEEDNERKQLGILCAINSNHERIFDGFGNESVNTQLKALDWLNTHHFDYRGLIEKGLAIAVTKENNPYKE